MRLAANRLSKCPQCRVQLLIVAFTYILLSQYAIYFFFFDREGDKRTFSFKNRLSEELELIHTNAQNMVQNILRLHSS